MIFHLFISVFLPLMVWISVTSPVQNSFLISKMMKPDRMVSRILGALTLSSCIDSTFCYFVKIDFSNFLHHSSDYLEASATEILQYLYLSATTDVRNWYLRSISDLGRTKCSSINNSWLRMAQIKIGWHTLSIQNSCHLMLLL